MENSYTQNCEKKKTFWQNSKTQIVTAHKISICDKTQIVTKHKISNCDKTQYLKLYQNSNGPILNKLKSSNYEKNHGIKMWKNSKTLDLIKQKSQNSDHLIFYKKIQLLIKKNKKKSFGTNNLRPWQPMICTQGSLLRSCYVFTILLLLTLKLLSDRSKFKIKFYFPFLSKL